MLRCYRENLENNLVPGNQLDKNCEKHQELKTCDMKKLRSVSPWTCQTLPHSNLFLEAFYTDLDLEAI